MKTLLSHHRTGVRSFLVSSAAALGLIVGLFAVDIASDGATGLIGSANAQGGGNGGGRAGGGGKPAFPGSGKGDLYADLVVLYRDEIGRPILIQKALLPELPGDPSPGSVFCLQPISADPVVGFEIVTNPAGGKQVSLVDALQRHHHGLRVRYHRLR